MRLLMTKLAAREHKRRSVDIAPGDDNSTVMDVHRVCLYEQAKPDT